MQVILLLSDEVMQLASGTVNPRCPVGVGFEPGEWHRACSLPGSCEIEQCSY